MAATRTSYYQYPGLTLSVAECQAIYRQHFGKDIPADLLPLAAAKRVQAAIGDSSFLAKLLIIRMKINRECAS